MKVEKRIHKGWKEMKEAKDRDPLITDLLDLFGKYQYIYSSDKGKISLVLLRDYHMDGKDLWEIYCLRGGLFEDVMKFNTKKEAEERIRELLE